MKKLNITLNESQLEAFKKFFETRKSFESKYHQEVDTLNFAVDLIIEENKNIKKDISDNNIRSVINSLNSMYYALSPTNKIIINEKNQICLNFSDFETETEIKQCLIEIMTSFISQFSFHYGQLRIFSKSLVIDEFSNLISCSKDVIVLLAKI